MFKLNTKSNLLIILSLIISVIIAVTSASFLLMNYQKASLMKTVPSAVEIDQKLSPDKIRKARNVAQKNNGKFEKIQLINATSTGPIALSKKISTDKCKIINQQDYIKLLKQQGHKQEINISFPQKTAFVFSVYPIKKSRGVVKINNNNFKLKETKTWPTYAKGRYAYIVVNNQDYQKIKQHNSKQVIYTINGLGLRDSEQLYKGIQQIGINSLSAFKTNKDATKYNSAAILMITFVSVLLFIFIGCILYFTILMENTGVIDEFKFLSNIGYSNKQLKKIATADNLLIFIPPVIIGLLNALIAFTGFRFEFLANDIVAFLGGFQMIGEPILITCLLFFVIYGIIYGLSYHKTKSLLKI